MAVPSHDIAARRAPIVPPVIDEHFEELVFLSIQDRKLLFSPDATQTQYAQHRARMEAHWDGLALSGAYGIDLARRFIDEGDPWECAVAVQAMLVFADLRPGELMDGLAEVDDEQGAGWREGLRRSPRERVESQLPADLDRALQSPSLPLIVDAWLWHDLLDRQTVEELAHHPFEATRAAVARNLVNHPDEREIILRLVDDENPDVARRALWSLASLDAEQVRRHCRSALSTSPDPFAAQLLGLLGTAEDAGRLSALLAERETRAVGIEAIGHLGDPAVVPDLIALFDDSDDEIAAAAEAAMLEIWGALPDSPDAESDATPAERALMGWNELETKPTEGSRWLRGRVAPWSGRGDDTTMEAIWREAASGMRDAEAKLRREVPDGFFTGRPSEEAIPGE